MPTYKVELEYTDNKDKTAKIKIKDDSDNLIAKSDAVIPNWLHEYEKYAQKIANLELNKFIFTDYSEDNCYANIDKLSQYHQTLGQYYIRNRPEYWAKDLVILKKDDFYSKKIIEASNDAITLPTNIFETLKNILSSEENTVTFQTRKKWFILDQKPCERNFDFNFNGYIELGNNIEKEEKWVKQQKEHEEYIKRRDELDRLYPKPSIPVDYENEKRLMKQIQNIPPRPEYVGKKVSKSTKTTKKQYQSDDHTFNKKNNHGNFLKIYQSIENAIDYDDSKSGPSM